MPLKVDLVAKDPLAIAADVVVVGVFAGFSTKTGSLARLDSAVSGALDKAIAREEFKGQREQQLELALFGKARPSRLVLVGLGSQESLRDSDLRVFAAKAARTAHGAKASALGLVLWSGLLPERLRYLAEGLVLGAYRFTKYMTGERLPKTQLAQVTLVLPQGARASKQQRDAIEVGLGVGNAVCWSRDLVSEPPNELTPAALASEAQRMAKLHGLRCQVFDRREIERRGMKLIVAVGRGSSNEPRFVHLSYVPKKPKKKLVFVGKGLTFDSGGLCIKPAAGMGEMKQDMSGAANVIGLLAACAVVKPDIEVHGIIASAENMPDGDAYRPGDVFGSLDGKTVEIINTDAEGRLVLADALAYAKKLKPDLMIDNATLTGACVVALGKTCSAFFTADDAVAQSFSSAAREAGEQFWRLPLLEDLKDQLKSDIADLKHTGDRWGGAISAALFLREFVGDVPWIHADIAGPVWADRSAGFYVKGATGHGVLTFLKLVEMMA